MHLVICHIIATPSIWRHWLCHSPAGGIVADDATVARQASVNAVGVFLLSSKRSADVKGAVLPPYIASTSANAELTPYQRA